MNKLKIGVFGAARGKTMMRVLLSHPEAELTAVCDKYVPLLNEVSDMAREQGRNVAVYENFDNFMEHNMDAVVLANYASEHAPYAIQLLESGRHVMSEVLPCETMAQTVALIEAVERSGLVYTYAENYCYRNRTFSTGDKGYESSTERGATTGKTDICLDGITIDSPESVIEHMQKYIFSELKKATDEFDIEARAKEIVDEENKVQNNFGPDILKTGYGFVHFPKFSYGTYGYENYFMAYVLYPEIIEKHFKLQGDLCFKKIRQPQKHTKMVICRPYTGLTMIWQKDAALLWISDLWIKYGFRILLGASNPC